MPGSDPTERKAAAEKRYDGNCHGRRGPVDTGGTAADQFLAAGATPRV